MNVFLRLKKVLLGALCVFQLAIGVNAGSNIHDEDPVNKLKKQLAECDWLYPANKDLLDVLPPFRPFCERAIQEVKNSIQPESEINLKQAQTDAINFFSKYLAKMPDILNISKEIIKNGQYTYANSHNWTCIAYSQMQSIISENDEWSDDIDGIVQSLMAGKTKDEIIKEHIPFLDINNPLNAKSVCEAKKFIDKIESKYMDLSNVSKNFEIKVFYTNQKQLLITTIHETGHVLDYAYRIKHGKRSQTFITEAEAISVLFETVAKRDFESNCCDILRLTAPYGMVAGIDLILRSNQKLNGTMSNIQALEQIRREIETDWQSPLYELMQLDTSNGEILKCIRWLRLGGSLEFKIYDHLKQMFRSKLLLDREKELINKMPEIIESLIMESTAPLTANVYMQLYKDIVV